MRFSLCIIILSLLLTACSSPLRSTTPTTVPTIEFILPPTPTPAPTMAYQPLPSDSTLERVDIYPDFANLYISQSTPVKVSLELNGNLPNGCHQLRVNVQPPNDQNQILIEVYSVVDSGAICAQVIQEFEVSVPLGSFPAGHYTVIVNGTEIGQFDA